MDQLNLLDQKLLLKDLPGMAYLCHNDSAWTMLFVSEGGKALTGWPPAAFINNRRVSFQSLIHPQDRPGVDQQIRDAVRRRRSFHVSYRLITRTGELKWVSETGSAVRNQHGGAWLLQGYITDVTTERNQESALSESIDNFNELTRAMPHVVWSANADGVVDYLSPTLELYCGEHSTEGLLPHERWEQAVHPADLVKARAAWRVAHQTGSDYSQEMRLRTDDDNYHWYLRTARPVHDRYGNIRKWYGAIIDIQERRLLLQDARRLASRLVNTLESITDGFITLDENWRISYINGKAEEVLNISRDDVLGIEMWSLFPESEVLSQHCRKAVEQQVAEEFSLDCQSLGKSFELRAYPSGDGIALYFHELAKNSQQHSQHLQTEKQGTERALQDIDNLLAIIQDSVRSLETERDEQRTQELIETIRRAAEKSSELSQQLLGAGR